MSIYEVIAITISISLLVLFTGMNMTVQTLKTELYNDETAIQSLSQEISDLKSGVNAIRLSKPFMKYDILFNDAPEILPKLPLNTVTATSLEDLSPILSVNSLYEIMQMSNQYFLAYPAIGGSTFSIQILSSPYFDRVLKNVRTLRGADIPAFEIQYGNNAGLFIGVFPTYTLATQYASSISQILFSTVGSTMSSWLIRQIP